MLSSIKFLYLFLTMCLFLHAAPAPADVARPVPIEEQRAAWHEQFPALDPGLDIVLAPDATALILRLTFKSPAVYCISLNGKERGDARVHELGGAERTEQLPFTPPRNQTSDWILEVDYKLYGVKNTAFGPKLTNETMENCAERRLTVTWENGKARLAVTKPAPEEVKQYPDGTPRVLYRGGCDL